jgi:hypothetical protein
MLVLMIEVHHCDLPFEAGAGLSMELLERYIRSVIWNLGH